MIKYIYFIITLFFIMGCSFKVPQNQWQQKSTNAFNSYRKNFLSANDAIAQSDLKRAIKHAKQSADLTQLARVYLGKCALNISVGMEDSCQDYLAISDLVKSEELNAYYLFITDSIIEENDIDKLPSYYQEYIRNLKDFKYKEVDRDILEMPRVTSTLLCAVLSKEYIDVKTRKRVIKLASFYGYKKVVLFWLNEQKRFTKSKKEKDFINKKILILQ